MMKLNLNKSANNKRSLQTRDKQKPAKFNKQKWIREIMAIAEVFGVLMIQLVLAGLLIHEVVDYVVYKISL